MNSIAPVWDGNETWLVLGGGGLMAAFPLAYAIILPALYPLLIAMLLGARLPRRRVRVPLARPAPPPLWDGAFTAGSLLAALAAGHDARRAAAGHRVAGRAYAGGWWDWLTPFSLLTGCQPGRRLCAARRCWLIWKTEGQLQADARRLARIAALGLLVAIGAVSLATPFVQRQYFERWFELPGALVAVPMPLLVLWVAVGLWASLSGSRDWLPFGLALLLFLLTMIGLGISIWPDVVPGRVTIWQAAAPHSSQLFMLVGALVLIPIILAYTGFSYWVFRGKVGEGGYH